MEATLTETHNSFFFFFFWNIKRSFQGLSYYFFHWHCGYIKFLQNAYEMCLYSQLSTSIVQFSSVAQSCPILCDPMNCSTPGLPVLQWLLASTQTHVHWVGDAIQPSHPLLFPSPPAPNPSQHQGLFQWVNSSHEVAKVLEFQLQHPSFQHPGLISFRMEWLDLLAVQGTLKSLLQHHKSWICLHPQKYRNWMKLCWMHAQKRKAHSLPLEHPKCQS